MRRLLLLSLLGLTPVAGRAQEDPNKVAEAWTRLKDYGCSTVAFQTGSDVTLDKVPQAPFRPGMAFDFTSPTSAHRPQMLIFPPKTGGNLATLLGHAAKLPNLFGVDLSDCKISGPELAALTKCPNLLVVYLDGTSISDDGMRHVAELKKLRWLDLTDTKVTDAGLAQLAALKELRVLKAGRAGVASDKEKSARITDDGLSALTKLSGLRELDLSGSAITLATAKGLSGLKNLRRLTLDRAAVSDAGLRTLAELPALERLSLVDTYLTGSGFKELARMPKLRDIDLTDARVTDAGAAGLGTLKQILKLELATPARRRTRPRLNSRTSASPNSAGAIGWPS
jgi:hypothetical protein